MKFNLLIYILLTVVFIAPLQAQNGKGQDKDKKRDKTEKMERKNQNKNKDKDKDKENTSDDDGTYYTDDAINEEYQTDDDGIKKPKKEKKFKEEKKAKKPNKGNSYGHDKYGLEGREFGQERARQAKLKNKNNKAVLEETVVVARRRIPTMQERIENSRKILVTQKPTLTEIEYDAKQLKLEEAVQKMSTLEKLVLVAQSYEKN